MENKAFYHDEFYKDEQGNVYTRMYLENEGLMKRATYTKIENPYEELQGVTVRCCYSQIFYPDSTRLLCNSIVEADPCLWEGLENGNWYDDDDNFAEVFQWYLIDNNTAERLKEHTKELIAYSYMLDLYVLAVTHFGTSWDYVGTDFVY